VPLYSQNTLRLPRDSIHESICQRRELFRRYVQKISKTDFSATSTIRFCEKGVYFQFFVQLERSVLDRTLLKRSKK